MKPSGQESWDRKANELLARMSKALDRKAGSATRSLDYILFLIYKKLGRVRVIFLPLGSGPHPCRCPEGCHEQNRAGGP